MDKELTAKLLRKEIRELSLITESFLEIGVYPKSILSLALQKTDEIREYILSLNNFESFDHHVYAENKTNDNDISVAQSDAITQNEILPVESVVLDSNIEQVSVTNIENEVNLISALDSKNAKTDLLHDFVEANHAHSVEIPNAVSLPEQVLEMKEIVPEIEVPKIESQAIVPQTQSPKQNNIVNSRNEHLAKDDSSLIANLAQKKVSDVKQAISIGDRFRFQRELFKGNGEDMNKTLTYLNQLSSYDEAIQFLESKYAWNEELSSKEDFLVAIRRRY